MSLLCCKLLSDFHLSKTENLLKGLHEPTLPLWPALPFVHLTVTNYSASLLFLVLCFCPSFCLELLPHISVWILPSFPSGLCRCHSTKPSLATYWRLQQLHCHSIPLSRPTFFFPALNVWWCVTSWIVLCSLLYLLHPEQCLNNSCLINMSEFYIWQAKLTSMILSFCSAIVRIILHSAHQQINRWCATFSAALPSPFPN